MLAKEHEENVKTNRRSCITNVTDYNAKDIPEVLALLLSIDDLLASQSLFEGFC